MNENEPNPIRSSKSLRAVIQGHPFSIEIYRLETEATWTLEVIDHTGASHVWNEQFSSDREARDSAIYTLETEGPAAFIVGDNVVLFRRN
tara:strand:- start:19314 stop:19583 length:270 start_codon:yes stop_codon:yes gene_type:complete